LYKRSHVDDIEDNKSDNDRAKAEAEHVAAVSDRWDDVRARLSASFAGFGGGAYRVGPIVDPRGECLVADMRLKEKALARVASTNSRPGCSALVP
jgi:hypothetical protein